MDEEDFQSFNLHPYVMHARAVVSKRKAHVYLDLLQAARTSSDATVRAACAVFEMLESFEKLLEGKP